MRVTINKKTEGAYYERYKICRNRPFGLHEYP